MWSQSFLIENIFSKGHGSTFPRCCTTKRQMRHYSSLFHFPSPQCNSPGVALTNGWHILTSSFQRGDHSNLVNILENTATFRQAQAHGPPWPGLWNACTYSDACQVQWAFMGSLYKIWPDVVYKLSCKCSVVLSAQGKWESGHSPIDCVQFKGSSFWKFKTNLTTHISIWRGQGGGEGGSLICGAHSCSAWEQGNIRCWEWEYLQIGHKFIWTIKCHKY